MFVQNIIKLSAAVHELSCAQAFCPILQKSSPVTLKFSGFWAAVKVHVRA